MNTTADKMIEYVEGRHKVAKKLVDKYRNADIEYGSSSSYVEEELILRTVLDGLKAIRKGWNGKV